MRATCRSRSSRTKQIPGSLETFVRQYAVEGTYQAYTEYRGKSSIRHYLAEKLAEFSGAPVDPDREIILTPGTQGALFLELPELTVDVFQFTKICRAQANVTVTPGTEFGKQFDHFVRMNFSQDHDNAVSAVKRICQLVERYRA